MPSPVPDRPGVLVRDPLGFSPSMMIISPPLLPFLRFFDGESTELDLREALVQASGTVEVGAVLEQLATALRGSGFLLNETFFKMKEEREREFEESPVRQASHAGGGGYPEDPAALRSSLGRYLDR